MPTYSQQMPTYIQMMPSCSQQTLCVDQQPTSFRQEVIQKDKEDGSDLIDRLPTGYLKR